MKQKFVFLTIYLALFTCGISVAQSYGYNRRLCVRYTRTSSKWGLVDSGWQCTADGRTSADIDLGDDTGWKNQSLQLLANGDTSVCFRHTRWSSKHGTVDTGYHCSKNGIPTNVIGIGDDTGWKDQHLYIKVIGPGVVDADFSDWSSKWGPREHSDTATQAHPADIYLGDDTGWKDQTINFTIY